MKLTSAKRPKDHPAGVRKLSAILVIGITALGLSGCGFAVDAIANNERESPSTITPVNPAAGIEAVPQASAMQGRFRLGDFDVSAPDYEFFNVCEELTAAEIAGMGLESNGVNHQRTFKNFAFCGFRNKDRTKSEVAYSLVSDEMVRDVVSENFAELNMPFESVTTGAIFHSPFPHLSDSNCMVSVSTTGGRLGVTALGGVVRDVSLEKLCSDADQKMKTILDLKGIS
ncbi:DUF3558 family protein [Corynebacterium sp. SCR221107]|nr:DUF3558 family protein [Corynebacterium sp. SCR221107]WBT10098.1 DUF3558 family protein [Corynebacterium sp. SCR221107]